MQNISGFQDVWIAQCEAAARHRMAARGR